MERKIGEIFEFGGEWYQCVEFPLSKAQYYCDGCSISAAECVDFICNPGEREDYKRVIFKKLEKVGEPFSNEHFGLVQKYELKMYGYSTKDKRVRFADGYDVFIEIKQNKEDMEENKLNLNPFDLQKAKEGKPVCTRDGHKARIICFDRNDLYPIVALIECEDGKEMIGAYSKEGQTEIYEIKGTDLMMLPEKKEGWVNVYKDSVYDTKDEALICRSGNGYIDTIKVSWEE